MKDNAPALAQAMTYLEIMEACAAYIAVKRPTIKEPATVCRIMSPLFIHSRQEHIYVLLLDTKSKLIGEPRELFRGLLDSCPMHPREVFKLAIIESAAALIIVHNLCGAPHKLCYVQRRLMLSHPVAQV